MPVIAKTILPSGTYDEKAKLREEMEIEMAQSNISKEKQLKELYYTLSHQNDADAITSFFDITKEERNQKIKSFSKQWKEGTEQTFDNLWQTMKKGILTRQEQ